MDNVVRVTLFDITSQMAEIDILNDLIKLGYILKFARLLIIVALVKRTLLLSKIIQEIVEKCAEPENSIVTSTICLT